MRSVHGIHTKIMLGVAPAQSFQRNGGRSCLKVQIQSNFNGSNTLGTMKICSRQGKFELVSVNHSARTGGKVEIYFHFL